MVDFADIAVAILDASQWIGKARFEQLTPRIPLTATTRTVAATSLSIDYNKADASFWAFKTIQTLRHVAQRR
jgi:hypothetical protein